MPERMPTHTFRLRSEHIALCDLLKAMGLASSGGQGKLMVEQGLVRVDGQLESRKTAKIRVGQTVTVGAETIRVSA